MVKDKDTIHIRKSREGLFTRKAKAHGKSVQSYATDVIRRLKGKTKTKAEVALLRQAVFAKNASKWGHKKKKK